MGISWNSDKIPSVKVHESKNNKWWRERRRALITLGQFIWFYLTQTANRSIKKKFSIKIFSYICWLFPTFEHDLLKTRYSRQKKKPRWIDSLKIMSSTNKSWKWFPNGWIFWSNFVFVFLNYYCSNFFDYNSHF